jgi:hypothetical protein
MCKLVSVQEAHLAEGDVALEKSEDGDHGD